GAGLRAATGTNRARHLPRRVPVARWSLDRRLLRALPRALDARGTRARRLLGRWLALGDRPRLGGRGVLPSGRPCHCRGSGAPADAAAGRRPAFAAAPLARALRTSPAGLHRGRAGPLGAPAVAAAHAGVDAVPRRL